MGIGATKAKGAHLGAISIGQLGSDVKPRNILQRPHGLPTPTALCACRKEWTALETFKEKFKT